MRSKVSDIGLAISDTLEPGSWWDYGSIGISPSPDYNLIDPNIFQENANSQLYLTFGSFWNDIYQLHVGITDLRLNPVFKYEAPRNIISNSSAPATVVEGAVQFKWASYYYLFFSSGQCCNGPDDLPKTGYEYKIMVCRSSDIEGPYMD